VVGQAPDVMTSPRMAALVTPIDAALLFPFYAEVNMNNAKFQWYQTGKRDQPSQSFYAVRSPASTSCLARYIWHVHTAVL